MDRIDPGDRFRLLDHGDVQVDDHRLLIAPHQHAFQRLVGAGVDFLVRDEGRDVDEVAGSRLGGEFQRVAPAHPGAAAHHIDHAFQLAMMVRAGLGVGMDRDRAGP